MVGMTNRPPDACCWLSRFLNVWAAACRETKQPDASLEALLARYASLYDRGLPTLQRPPLSNLEETLRTRTADWIVNGEGSPPAEAIRRLREMAQGR